MSEQLLSILVPMYNESAVIDRLFEALERTLAQVDMAYEIICVDDGSKDTTRQQVIFHTQRDSRIKAVFFSRNFGKEAAMTAALDYASGDAVIPIDADLQDPPELIIEMVAKWREGYDVVYAKRISRDTDTPMKRNSAGGFYKLFNAVSEFKIPENVGDYRLMSRRVVDAIKLLPEKDRFMKGLFCWPGFSNTTVEFERQARVDGETKFNYWKLWNFALAGITSFSSLPIRLGGYLGLGVSAVAFLYGSFIFLRTLITGVDVPGYASLMIVVLFIGGVQLFFMGLMGEYIGRIYKEVKNRPIYLVEQQIGFQAEVTRQPSSLPFRQPIN